MVLLKVALSSPANALNGYYCFGIYSISLILLSEKNESVLVSVDLFINFLKVELKTILFRQTKFCFFNGTLVWFCQM